MTKYREEPKDISRHMSDLEKRVRALESGQRIGFTAMDTGSLVVGGNDGSTVMTSGEGIPIELFNYYNFFGWSIVNAVLQKKDDTTYTYNATILVPGQPNPISAFGVVVEGLVRECYGVTTGFDNVPLMWIGITTNAELNLGSGLFGFVRLNLTNSVIHLGQFPFSLPVRLCTNVLEAICDANLTLSTSQQNVSGAVITTDTIHPNAIVEVHGTFDFQETGAGTTLCQGGLVVDGGTVETEMALFGVTATTDRATINQMWHVPLAASGSHTFQLVAQKSAAVGTQIVNSTHTKITAKLWEL